MEELSSIFVGAAECQQLRFKYDGNGRNDRGDWPQVPASFEARAREKCHQASTRIHLQQQTYGRQHTDRQGKDLARPPDRNTTKNCDYDGVRSRDDLMQEGYVWLPGTLRHRFIDGAVAGARRVRSYRAKTCLGSELLRASHRRAKNQYKAQRHYGFFLQLVQRKTRRPASCVSGPRHRLCMKQGGDEAASGVAGRW